MGCTSSKAQPIDPETGLAVSKPKKPMFSSTYPGAKRPVNAPYTPPSNEFEKTPDGKTHTVTKHFVNYGGGNALTLVDGPPPSFPQKKGGDDGEGDKKFVQVTLPPGVSAGESIRVAIPSGQLIAVTVPPGMSAGSVFTVEFVDTPPPTATAVVAETAVVPSPTNHKEEFEKIPIAQAVPL